MWNLKKGLYLLSNSVVSDCLQPDGCKGSSVHGILQARILKWVTISSFRGSSPSRDRTQVSCTFCICRQILYHRWRQEEKGTTEDEMVGWHQQPDEHEFEQAPEVSDGQGSLACCSPWGHKKSDTTEQLNWLNLYHWATWEAPFKSIIAMHLRLH